jgi:hypothetical protein
VTIAVPRHLEEITPSWLSEALGLEVADVTVTPIAVGEGFMGRLARVGVSYASGVEGPESLIAKMPTADPGGQALGMMLRLWEREGRFYEDIAPRLPVRTARCWYSGAEPDDTAFLLLLEDLGSLEAGDQVAGATPRQAELVVEWMARLHAAWWGSPALAELGWLPEVRTDAMYQGLPAMLEAVWPKFAAEFGDAAPGPTLEWAERVVGQFPQWLFMQEQPDTLMHADFRLDNMFFEADTVVVVDWQSVAVGQAGYDLAYFLGGSLEVDQRRATEAGLLERYRRVMAEDGVELSADELLDGYRKSLVTVMGVGTLLMGQLDLSVNERAVDLGKKGINRMFTAALDHRVDELL